MADTDRQEDQKQCADGPGKDVDDGVSSEGAQKQKESRENLKTLRDLTDKGLLEPEGEAELATVLRTMQDTELVKMFTYLAKSKLKSAADKRRQEKSFTERKGCSPSYYYMRGNEAAMERNRKKARDWYHANKELKKEAKLKGG